MAPRIRFILNGCDIRFYAEAPADITLEQLLKQCDRIYPDWCACGICSYERDKTSPETEPEIMIDYDGIRKVNDDVACVIKEQKASAVSTPETNEHEDGICPVCGKEINFVGSYDYDDYGATLDFECPYCGADGKAGYNFVFDNYYNVRDKNGNDVNM